MEKNEDTIRRVPASTIFRNEEYQYIYSYYQEPNGDTYTTTELDEVNMAQVYNQYRVRYGIPFVDEIEQIKEDYGLSSSKLAMILGFGENQIGNYLDGEIPNKANGKALSVIRNVTLFEEYVEMAKSQLGERAYQKIKWRIEEVKKRTADPRVAIIFPIKERSIYNGYAAQDIFKIKDVIMCALSRMGYTFKTKMNKILFYIDMVSYRERGVAITGLAYKSEKYGVIPFRNEQVFSLLEIPQTVIYDDDRELTPFSFDNEYVIKNINEEERRIIEMVCDKFRGLNSREISEINHKEDVWEKYYCKNIPIPFVEAFGIKQA